MALNRPCIAVARLILPALSAVVWIAALLHGLPAVAADECSAVAQDSLGKLRPGQTVVTEEIAGLPSEQIEQIQTCLNTRGCYAQDPGHADGKVGRFTAAALRRAADGTCTASPPRARELEIEVEPQAESAFPNCGDGEEMVSWQLNGAAFEALQAPLQPASSAMPVTSSATPTINGGAVSPVSGGPTPPVSSGATAPVSGSPAASTSGAPAPIGGGPAGANGGTPAAVNGGATSPIGSGAVSPVSGGSAAPSGAPPPIGSGSAPAGGANAPADSPFDELEQVLLNADYPSGGQLDTALTVFSGILKLKIAKERLHQTATHACVPHPFGKSVGAWLPDWNTPMYMPLSHPVYGFLPYWLFAPEAAPSPPPSALPSAPAESAPASGAKKPRIDFGMLDRIGWFGVTFSVDGNLDVPPWLHQPSGPAREVETARRFRTSVDLVVYRRQTRAQWLGLVSKGSADYDPDAFSERLSSSIAGEVSAPVSGLLNGVQAWIMPGILTFAPTAWDGVTLYLEDFPFEDKDAMAFFCALVQRLRKTLSAREQPRTVWSDRHHHLALNLVIPYGVFVPKKASETEASIIDGLARLIPNARSDIPDALATGNGDDPVDNIIVFLPQNTSDEKKLLRQSVENAFNRSATNKAILKNNPDVSLAIWRRRLLRKMIYVLSPASEPWKGDYSRPGGQFYDDVVYAADNFAAVGFWPAPVSDAQDQNQRLSNDVRDVFSLQRGAQSNVVKILGPAFANGCGAYRRELFVVVEGVALLVSLYAVCAYWVFELRRFFHRYFWWFAGLVAVDIAVLMLVVEFDRRLQAWAQDLTVALAFLTVIAIGVRQYFVSSVEKDLP